MKDSKLISTLKKYYLFDIHAIEKEAGIPHTTLNSVCNGKRDLPAKYIAPLTKAMKKRKML